MKENNQIPEDIEPSLAIAYAKKTQAEKEIAAIIESYEQETGLKIESMHLDVENASSFNETNNYRIVAIKLKIEL